MPSLPELITLVIDGQGLQGWQSVSITRNAEAAAISFTLNATNPAWSAQARLLRTGKELKIYTTAGGEFGSFGGGDLLCTGHIDDYEAENGEAAHREVGISGRSKAGDAIDCPPAKHKTGRVEKKDLAGVAKEFDEWGIGFKADVKLGKIPVVQLVPGESMFKTLEREARRLGVLLTGQPDGSVSINRAGEKRHAGALVEGLAPLKKSKVRFSIQNKRSPIIARGQTALGTGAKALRQEEREEDGTVERNRPYILFNENSSTSKELKRRAKWEQLRRSGSGVAIHATVSTWRDEGGMLWAPGYLLSVQIGSEDIDQDLCIKHVTYLQSIENGTSAELELVEPTTLGGKATGGGTASPDLGTGGGVEETDSDADSSEEQGEE